MRRREFIALVGGVAATWPIAVRAQQLKMLKIGVLSPNIPRMASIWFAFDQRLRELGYIEGQNLRVDFVSVGPQPDRYAEEARKLVAREPNLLIAPGTELAVKSARAATHSLPIVMVAIDYDPIALGYVASLARPGGNVTGIFAQQIEQTEKRLQLLKEALPELKSATVLWDRISADQWHTIQRIAPSQGIRLSGIELDERPRDYDRLLGQAAEGYRNAVIGLMTPEMFQDRALVAGALLRRKMASVFGLRQYADAGALFSFGVNIDGLFRRAAEFADRIAKGTKPADLPVEQPTRFELVVNLKTAKALGIEVPTSILLRADEVIE
jgi:putative ABC transport system substrate-binding protein